MGKLLMMLAGGVNALTVDVGDGTASGADDFADALLRMHHHHHQ